ncbi:MAG: hypothetical protein M1489_02860 [Firmicutes bacterium]|nr:hypothetical protein [Bacillota bacterium]
MPIPLLLGAAAVICTGVGVKKAIDAKYDNDRAEEFNYEAECIFDEAKESLEYERNKTQDILVGLGKLKLEVWDQQLGRFIKTFEQIRNVKFEGQAMTGQLKNNHFTKDELMKMKDISLKAGEVMASGATALGAGALAGVASYGGAMMFATASTGTAISALSGVAATNATLAWFGGGSLAAGGLGIAGGTAVLGGIVAGPVLAVGGMIL